MDKIKYFFQFCKYAIDRRKVVKLLLITLLFTLSQLVGCRAQHAIDTKRYEAEVEQLKYYYEVEAPAEAAALAQKQASENNVIDVYEYIAEDVAKVLYGYRNNSEADLRLVCACIFNRTEHYMYSECIQDVCRQENQWMGYSDDNPVLEHLFEIAVEEVTNFYEGERRSVAPEYIYMSWSENEIVLRDTFEETNRTHYWRVN